MSSPRSFVLLFLWANLLKDCKYLDFQWRSMENLLSGLSNFTHWILLRSSMTHWMKNQGSGNFISFLVSSSYLKHLGSRIPTVSSIVPMQKPNVAQAIRILVSNMISDPLWSHLEVPFHKKHLILIYLFEEIFNHFESSGRMIVRKETMPSYGSSCSHVLAVQCWISTDVFLLEEFKKITKKIGKSTLSFQKN